MKIQIKHRYTDAVLFTHDCDNNSLKLTVEAANAAHINLIGCNLSCSDLAGISLSNLDLSHSDLTGSDLSVAHLINCNLTEVELTTANLEESKLTGSNITRGNFNCANLRRTDLTDCTLTDTLMTKCRGNNKQIKSLHLSGWDVAFDETRLAVGDFQYLITDWQAFNDEQIITCFISPAWWSHWKDFIFQAIELCESEK